MASRRVIFQPVAPVLQGHGFELRGRDTSNDRRVVDPDNRGKIAFARVPDFRLIPRRGSSQRFFSGRRRAHAAGKNAFSNVG